MNRHQLSFYVLTAYLLLAPVDPSHGAPTTPPTEDDQQAQLYNAEDDELTFDRPRETHGFNCGAYKVVHADFDQDGHLDLAVSYNQSDAIAILKGDGKFGFTLSGVSHHPTDPVGNACNLTAGDIDGDGFPDLAVALHERPTIDTSDKSYSVEELRPHFRGRIQIFRNVAGTMIPARRYQTPSSGQGVAMVDLDNDGLLDLVYTARGVGYIRGDLKDGRFMIRKGYGNFKFGPPKIAKAGWSAYYAETVDVNGDGYLDIFAPNERAPTVTYLLNPGVNIFQPESPLVPRKINVQLDAHPNRLELNQRKGSHFNANNVRIADFTGDDKPDALIVWMDQSALQLQRGNGDGTFVPHSILQAGPDAAFLGLGDFDHDGDMDFVVTHWQQDFVSVGLNDATGHFSLTQYPAGNGSYGVTVADFDQDGHLDFISANYRHQSMNIYQGNGDGTFLGQSVLPGSLRLHGGEWSLHNAE